ncbi:lysoplasmalogenase [Flagellimonas sp. DF-77]|uniref:lysoplasmalogenase n=1 Tax=Flagellimonas algarum TaxID=3230298 RepID=UPI00339271B3
MLDHFDSEWYAISKPLTTILIIVLPFLGNEVDTKFRRTLFLALCFCLLGDILLLKNAYFVFGLGSFLIAHVCFAKGFIGLAGFQRNPGIAVVLLLIGIGLYTWLYPDLGALKYPVAAYVSVILFMAWQGIGIYVVEKTKAYALITLGTVLFLFSDSMIAVDRFKAPFELSGMVILATYWLAIALIANAALLISTSDQKK